MRLLLLVALVLAGCAAPAPPPSVKPAANTRPVHPMHVPAPAPAAQPQEAEPQQNEILEPPRIVKGWLDISGRKRDDAALYQDSAACRIVHKRAVKEALRMYPEPQPDKDGTHNARAARIRQQSIRSHADAAYMECMESKGWRKK